MAAIRLLDFCKFDLILPRDATLSAVYAVVVCLCVCVSVCLFVTLRYCIDSSWLDCFLDKLCSQSTEQYSSIGLGKRKTTRGWYFTHTPKRCQWADHFGFWRAESRRQRNHTHQSFHQSFLGYRSSYTPKSGYLRKIAWSIIQQCKHYRATLWYCTSC